MKKVEEIEIVKELTKYCVKLGRFPLYKEFPNKLQYAIYKSGKYINYYRELMGYAKTVYGQDKYWYQWENVVNAIKYLSAGSINFPTRLMIRNFSLSLEKSIKRFGGIEYVAEKLGYKLNNNLQARDGHFLDSGFELLIDEYLYSRNIAHSIHGYICRNKKYRFDFKIGDFYFEIWGFSQKGKCDYAVEYNKKRKIKEKLYEELKLSLISINYEVFKNNACNIEKYMDDLLSRLGFDVGKKIATYNIKEIFSKGININEKTVIDRFLKLINKLGYVPYKKDLIAMGEGNLAYAIDVLGGLDNIKVKMGFYSDKEKFEKLKNKRLPNGYWNYHVVKDELKKITENLGYFPSLRWLTKNNYNGVKWGIDKFGGVNYWRNIMGVEKPTPKYKQTLLEGKKQCNKCSKVLFLKKFGKDNSKKDGRCTICKLCRCK